MPDGTSSSSSSATTLHEIKISELPVAPAVSDTDQLEANQAGTSRSITVGQVKAAAVAAVPVPPTLPPLGFLHAGSFGVVTGTTTDQSVALQAAINAAEAQKLKLVLPAGYIRLDATIFVGRADPVWIEGQQPHRFIGFTDNQTDDVTVLWFENMPASTVAIQVAATNTANSRDGVTIKNVMVARSTSSVAGDGRIGIRFIGTTNPCLENVSIDGFDINLHLTEDTAGTRHTTYGQFRNVISMLSGTYCGLITAATDCDFYHCHFGGAATAGFRITAPVLSAVASNGNRWFGCIFTASQGTVPTHALMVEAGFWQSFHACDFEGSSNASVKIDVPVDVATPSVFNVTMTDCWFSAAVASSAGCLWVNSGNLMLQGGRFAGVSTCTEALIRIKPAAFNSGFASIINNITATYRAIAAVDVTNYGYLKITNNQFVDGVAGGLPAIIFGAAVNRSHVIGNSFNTTHAMGYTNASVANGNRFLDNVLANNNTADDYTVRVVGGTQQTVGGTTARHQLLGTGVGASATLVARYAADSTAGQDFIFRSRSTAPGTRVPVIAGDGLRARRFYADDGTTDQEVAREAVNVDAIAGFMGGSWEIFVKASTTGNLVSRLKIDNIGVMTTGPATLSAAGTFQYIGTTSGADTLIATPGFGVFIAYTTGAFYIAKAGATNATTTPTLNINGLGAKTIVKRAATALAAGDIVTGMMLHFVYDGANMQLLNPVVN